MTTAAPRPRRVRRGYVLFEVVLALTIFASAVLSLATSLNSALETGVNLNRENAIRMGLRSFIEETRRKEVADMATEARDDRLDVTYSSTVEELSLKNKDGTLLADLYVLHAKASYGEGEAAREETTDLYVYKPKITETAEGGTATAGATQPQSNAGAGAGGGGGGAPQGGGGGRGADGGSRGGGGRGGAPQGGGAGPGGAPQGGGPQGGPTSGRIGR
jgi:type II secretory pathway component PulJ